MHVLISLVALLAAGPAPLTTIKLTGEVTFEGKLVVQCMEGNPRTHAGWQFRGGTPGRTASGAYLMLNFRNSAPKTAGDQPLTPGTASTSIEFSPRDGVASVSYFGIPGQAKVTLSPDFKTATVEGPFSNATSDAAAVTVKATVTCQ